MRRLAYYLATLLFIALLMLVPPTAAGAPEDHKVVKVSIRDFYFEPSQLVIEPGTTVRWVNEGDTQHTVFATNPAGTFLSGTLDPGESFEYTFPERFPRPSPDSTVRAGTYRYYCELHPNMMKARVNSTGRCNTVGFSVLFGSEVGTWLDWVVRGCPRHARRSCGRGGRPGSPSATSPGR